MRSALRISICLALATLVWMPFMHLPFRPAVNDFTNEGGVPAFNRAILERHLAMWEHTDEAEISRMRVSNAEWDFMGRTFFLLALADAALLEPEQQARYLTVMDKVIDDTLRLEKEQGHYYFLMDYAKGAAWEHAPHTSIFVNGEIALMLGLRRALEEHEGYRRDMHARLDRMVARMEKSPILFAESYPDECWTFCNTVGIAAIHLGTVLDEDRNDRPFIDRWLARLKDRMIHPETGMLVSEVTVDGTWQDGPEGSSIFLATHCLRLVDPVFAEDQYQRAKKELVRSFVRFGYAREWPEGFENVADIDSGPVVPILQISPGSSGLALLGAASAGDHAVMQGLLTSLRFAGFPTHRGDTLAFNASNQVGDAVVACALFCGPVWEKFGVKP